MSGINRSAMIRSLAGFAAGLFAAAGGAHAQAAKPHRIVIQVDQNDADVMNLALNNVKNVLDYYRDKSEDVEIEIVAYGPGLHMLREDTSPVKDRIKQLSEVSFPSKIVFSACNNTKQAMENAKAIRSRSSRRPVSCRRAWCGSWSSRSKATVMSNRNGRGDTSAKAGLDAIRDKLDF